MATTPSLPHVFPATESKLGVLRFSPFLLSLLPFLTHPQLGRLRPQPVWVGTEVCVAWAWELFLSN